MADATRQLIGSRPDDRSLTGQDLGKLFPLASAAMNGYASMVEALLESIAVRQQVNAKSLGKAAPLTLARLTPPLWACGPARLISVSWQQTWTASRRPSGALPRM
ncbi:hypothetical protein [Pelomonas cellulosilytica]|uniref:Uncharacterized protein n=1 Tax=Pelomonas cellulosilytica TaxID=2906762 RepID=A0ABS8XRH6_9BURK|nr:hypothetical protein [Pelomonas sp. P8]MCE4555326.1 hypothetical protein [Pelomonas sp. P8]